MMNPAKMITSAAVMIDAISAAGRFARGVDGREGRLVKLALSDDLHVGPEARLQFCGDAVHLGSAARVQGESVMPLILNSVWANFNGTIMVFVAERLTRSVFANQLYFVSAELKVKPIFQLFRLRESHPPASTPASCCRTAPGLYPW